MMPTAAMRDDDAIAMTVAPLRWQTHFYRSYLSHALKKLANDPNPAVQRIGQDMDRCLNCAHHDRCTSCPFRPSADAVRGLGL